MIRTFACATFAGMFTVGVELLFQAHGLAHHLPLTFAAYAGLFSSAMRCTEEPT